MKQLEIIDSFGDKVVVEPELGLYTTTDFMGNKMPCLGIQLYSYDEDGDREPYATLTVNLGEFLSVKDCAYIDTNNNSFTAQLLNMGFCQDTGLTKQSGFCVYPLWKFDKDFLKEIDVNGLYDIYEKKVDKYFNEGPTLPVWEREQEILSKVTESLEINCKIDCDQDELVVSVDDSVYYGAEFYRYLLAEVCEYDKNGAVKGLELDLCHDFYDLCEHNEVYYSEYIKEVPVVEMEYVITMSSDGGTVRDFLTCSSRKEAKEVCESYNWTFMDENEFAWSLHIEEREVSLDDVKMESKNDNTLYYYEIHVIEDKEKELGYSIYFSYDEKLEFEDAVCLAVENKLLDLDDVFFVDDLNILSEEEYKKATNSLDCSLNKIIENAKERSEETLNNAFAKDDLEKE